MRPNASVLSFTLVPSRLKWKQASFWHPEDHTCILHMKKSCSTGFSWLYISQDEYLFDPGFEQMSKHIITSAWEMFLLLLVPVSDVSHLKHLKWSISDPWEISKSCAHTDSLEPRWCSIAAQHLWHLFFSGSNECLSQRLAERWIFFQWLEEPLNKWLTLFQMTGFFPSTLFLGRS